MLLSNEKITKKPAAPSAVLITNAARLIGKTTAPLRFYSTIEEGMRWFATQRPLLRAAQEALRANQAYPRSR